MLPVAQLIIEVLNPTTPIRKVCQFNKAAMLCEILGRHREAETFARLAQGRPSQGSGDSLTIALVYGCVCI